MVSTSARAWNEKNSRTRLLLCTAMAVATEAETEVSKCLQDSGSNVYLEGTDDAKRMNEESKSMPRISHLRRNIKAMAATA